jgi:hypothetical protein
MEPVKIEITESAIEAMTDSEKLSTLIKIAFRNADMLNRQGAILFGNGKEGVCDIVRFHARSLKGLWWVVCTAIIGFAGVLFGYLSVH